MTIDRPTAGILGCGPAGLLAAYGAASAGFHVTIYSRKAKSEIGGAQFIHQYIPGLPAVIDPAVCNIVYKGTAPEYANKVYKNGEAPTSWGLLRSGRHEIWDMVRIYEWLWGNLEPMIKDMNVSPMMMTDLSQRHDILFSTIPVPQICYRVDIHGWQSQPVWIKYDHTPDEPGAPLLPNNTILYNGDSFDPFYRASNLFGVRSMEYGSPTLVGSEQKLIHKPLSTDCDCHPGVVRLGRYGTWTKGVLAHEAYFGAKEACDALLDV